SSPRMHPWSFAGSPMAMKEKENLDEDDWSIPLILNIQRGQHCCVKAFSSTGDKTPIKLSLTSRHGSGSTSDELHRAQGFHPQVMRDGYECVIIRATCVEYIGLICKSNFRKSMVHQCKVVIASEKVCDRARTDTSKEPTHRTKEISLPHQALFTLHLPLANTPYGKLNVLNREFALFPRSSGTEVLRFKSSMHSGSIQLHRKDFNRLIGLRCHDHQHLSSSVALGAMAPQAVKSQHSANLNYPPEGKHLLISFSQGLCCVSVLTMAVT
ncbi:hypothetical protein F2P79_013552, partial [Pimephales promelas]